MAKRATRPPTKRVYTLDEVKTFLSSLEYHAREAAGLAKTAESDARNHNYRGYRRFRDKVSEYHTLAILTEGRIRHFGGTGHEKELGEQFNKLELLMLGILIKSSLKFFFVLSANPVLPLGTRELFSNELQSLHAAARKLEQPEFADHVSGELQNDLEIAREILEEIIEKAPSLLDFGKKA